MQLVIHLIPLSPNLFHCPNCCHSKVSHAGMAFSFHYPNPTTKFAFPAWLLFLPAAATQIGHQKGVKFRPSRGHQRPLAQIPLPDDSVDTYTHKLGHWPPCFRVQPAVKQFLASCRLAAKGVDGHFPAHCHHRHRSTNPNFPVTENHSFSVKSRWPS